MNVDILVVNIEGLEVCDTVEQLFMCDGLLGEGHNLTRISNDQYDLLVGMEVECNALKDNLVELMKGDLTNSITCDICIKCSNKFGSQRIVCNFGANSDCVSCEKT